MEAKWLLLCFFFQAIIYLLILLYIWYNHRKNGDKKPKTIRSSKPKVETLSFWIFGEKIKTWMDNAHFRSVPIPDLELAFPRLAKLQFEGTDTPRLLVDALPTLPVIAQDVEMVTPHVAQVEAEGDSEHHSSASSTPDPPLKP